LIPTFECISVYANFSNDDNGNNTASLSYRRAGSGASFIPGMALTVDRRNTVADGTGSASNPFVDQWRGSILGLQPNTTYEVKVTFSDPDGVTGTNPLIMNVTTRSDSFQLGSGNTYYVSKNGSDSASGTLANPWRTIQHAENSISAGDTVYIRGGTYTETISINVKGTANNLITFLPYSSENVIIDGANTSGSVITLNNADYIRFSHITVQNAQGSLIYLNNDSSGNIIEYCLLRDYGRDQTDGGVVIARESNNNTIQYNTITSDRNDYGDKLHREAGILFAGYPTSGWGVTGFGNVVRYNQITSVDDGISDGMGGMSNNTIVGGPYKDTDIYGNLIINAADDGIEAEGGGINVRIWENTIENSNMSALGLATVTIGPLFAFRNQCYNLRFSAVKTGYDESHDGHTYLYHNSFFSDSFDPLRTPGIYNMGGSGYTRNFHSLNNILIGTSGQIIMSSSGAHPSNSFDYDCLWQTDPSADKLVSWNGTNYTNNPTGWSNFQSASGQEINGVRADPLFVNPNIGNVQLQSGSLCIDAGAIILGFNDANSPWPYNGYAPDIGACEYGGGPAIDTTPPYTTGHSPAKSSTSVSSDTNIVVHVRDNGTGVDQSSIVMSVEGLVVSPTITGTPYDYLVTYNPPADFNYEQVVDVTINAKDLNSPPNIMTQESYSFTIQSEPAPDNTPPYTSDHNPAKNSTSASPNINIVVHVRDSGTGVDQSSIQMRVEGSLVSPTITGTSSDYTVTYNPPTDFSYEQVVNVTINAQDLESPPNVMAQDSYSFTIQSEDEPPSDDWLTLPFRVNCAGSDYTDVYGNLWNADQAYTSGYWGVYGSSSTLNEGTSYAIANTADDRIYQTKRYKLSEYRFDLGSGVYDVSLHFAETYYSGSGERYFDVSIEGQLVLDNLDVYSEVGGNTALIKTINGVSVTDGQLNISFSSVRNYTFINGIMITASSGNQPPVALNDYYSIELDNTLSVTSTSLGVLSNDSDINGDSLSAVILTDVSHGNLTFNSNGSFIYTPDEGYTGSDIFSYRANDGQANSNIATVIIYITSDNGSDGDGGDGTSGGDSNVEITSVLNYVSLSGKFSIEVIAQSSDNIIQINIPKDTVGTDSMGVRLINIAIEKMIVNTPPPPDDAVIVGSVYSITPDDANFEPAISLTMSYSDNQVPYGVAEKNLIIGIFNPSTGEWEKIPSSINLAENTVTASLEHFSTYALLAYTRPASFEIADISTPDIVTCGSNIDIQVTVINTGDLTGDYEVRLVLDGEVFDTELITLDGGDSTIVIFNTTTDVSGSHRVSIGVVEKTFTAEAYEAPAEFITSNINVTPSVIYLGESVDITTLISNIGDLPGVYETVLKMDNEFIDSRNVNINGGDSEIITFTLTPDTEGEHAINIGNKVVFFTVKSTENVDVDIITMAKPEISRFDITPTYNPGTGKIESTRIDYQIINSENLDAGSTLILKVFRNGELWEEITLITLDQVETDQDTGYLSYVPAAGWSIGTYIFEAELQEPSGVVHSIQFEKFSLIEESLTKAISWGSLGIIIGGTLIVLLTVLAIVIYHRREMLRGYVE
jgi:hypothetical protein